MKTLEIIYWLRFASGIIAALMCISYGIVTGTIPTNLVLNPSVETGETGAATPHEWFSSQTGTEWNVTYARTGSRSIRINIANASAEWRSRIRQVREGSTYQVQGFFRGEVTKGPFFLTVRWFSDSEGLSLIAESDASIPIGSYPEWSRLEDDFAAPEETKACEVAFRTVNGSGDIYGDDFEIRRTESWTSLLNGVSIALVTYLISYYIIKSKFSLKVEKPQKLVTMGIGIYFISWIVFWTLLYTIVATTTA